VSDDTARRIDGEVRKVIDNAFLRAKEILVANMDKLHAMASALLLYETIDAPQIDAIMSGREPDPPRDWPTDSGEKPPVPPVAGPIGGPAAQT
jgi:cell division protease FtsH